MLQSEPFTVSKSVTLTGEILNTTSACNKSKVVEFFDEKKSMIGGVGVEGKITKEINGEAEGGEDEEVEEENADESFYEDDDDEDDDDYSGGGENDESFYPDQDEDDEEEEEEEEERDRRRKRSSNTKRSITSTDRLFTEISDIAEEGSKIDLEGIMNFNDVQGGEEEEEEEVEEDEEGDDSSSDDGENEDEEEEEEEDKKTKKRREIKQKHQYPIEVNSEVKVNEEEDDEYSGKENEKKDLINSNNSSSMILDLTNSDVREDITVSHKTIFKNFNLNSMAMRGASSLFSSAPLKITKTVTKTVNSSDAVTLANTESKKPFQTYTVKELQLLLKARKLTISGT